MTRARYSSICSVVKTPCVPTRLLISSTGCTTFTLNTPCARRRISPSFESLNATGSRVPQVRFAKSLRLTKYTSARSGLFIPQGAESSFVRIGTLPVTSVCRPGPNAS